MGWKDLQKLIGQGQQNQQTQYSEFQVFKGKPFWIWDITEHRNEDILTSGNCCFNHILSLPRKDNIEKPLFDYEKIVLDSLEYDKCLWILKSTGLGISELFLRYMCYLALRDNTYQDSQMVIVTGPNIDLAIKLVKRMKNMFMNKFHNITFDTKETVLELKKCRIEAYPSNHIDSFRSLDNPKFIYLDECDFFRKGEQEDVRAVAERYIGKSNPFIVMVSTPNAPGGLMQTIEQEPEDICLYKRIKLDYRYGLNKIYTIEDIERAKQSPSFDREYDLKYLGKIGNVFAIEDIERAVQLGEKYKDLPLNNYCLHIGGIDFGFSTSITTIYIAELDTENEIVKIVLGEQHDKTTPSVIGDRIFQLHTEIPNLWWFVDGSNRAAVNECKSKFGESLDWDRSENVSPEFNIVIPVSFAKEHKQMLEHTYQLLTKQKLAIPFRFDRLILSLKTAYANEWNLDKNVSVHNDDLDALRLLLKGVKFVTSE